MRLLGCAVHVPTRVWFAVSSGRSLGACVLNVDEALHRVRLLRKYGEMAESHKLTYVYVAACALRVRASI